MNGDECQSKCLIFKLPISELLAEWIMNLNLFGIARRIPNLYILFTVLTAAQAREGCLYYYFNVAIWMPLPDAHICVHVCNVNRNNRSSVRLGIHVCPVYVNGYKSHQPELSLYICKHITHFHTTIWYGKDTTRHICMDKTIFIVGPN